MIMEWKKKDNTYHAVWRGAQLILSENPVIKRWCMTAEGLLVRQTWPSVRKAMDDIEARQQRIVMQAVQQGLKLKDGGVHGPSA